MKYDDYLSHKKREHGDRFDSSDLSQQFVRYYNSGERIKVQTLGMIFTGRVGVTTGWKPCFLLIQTSRSIGSPWTLSDKDRILGVQKGRKYVRA